MRNDRRQNRQSSSSHPWDGGPERVKSGPALPALGGRRLARPCSSLLTSGATTNLPRDTPTQEPGRIPNVTHAPRTRLVPHKTTQHPITHRVRHAPGRAVTRSTWRGTWRRPPAPWRLERSTKPRAQYSSSVEGGPLAPGSPVEGQFRFPRPTILSLPKAGGTLLTQPDP